MAVGDAYVFPGFLTPVLTQLFFPKPPTTFLTCFCRKYAGKKSHLNRGSNTQPQGHESDTLTTEPSGRGLWRLVFRLGVPGSNPARSLHFFNVFLNPFPNNKNSSKLKEFADDNFKFDENVAKFSKMVENTVGKGEISRCEQFLLFPQCFQNTYTADK